MVHITGHVAHNIKATRGNMGWGRGRNSGYHPRGDRWCVRVSQKRVFSLLRIDCHPCAPLILEVKGVRSSVLKADQSLLMNHGIAELKTGQKIKRTAEPAS